MGQTGSIEWGRIKGRKGKVRLVEKKNLDHYRPGPAQRYTSSGAKRRRFKRSQKAIQK
jgi:hypothetical protein